ncbi:MAG: ABC transporter ATP-binding protein [Elusimicrobia bacterium]|nr:ABC transporter ATP-binding protein [Elusimicrobiota bacterium]
MISDRYSKSPLIEISKSQFSYDGIADASEFILRDFRIFPGEIIFLHGRSGCGKTTFLNLMSGVLRSNLSDSIRSSVRCLGYIMHDSTLLPWLSVTDNVVTEAALRRHAANVNEFEKLCLICGLYKIKDLLPRQLSLGMRQRVELCKALSFNPDLLLLDESFTGIDAITKAKIMSELHRRVEGDGLSIIATAHQIVDVLRIATRIYLVDNGILCKSVAIKVPCSERLAMSVQDLIALPEASMLLEFDSQC